MQCVAVIVLVALLCMVRSKPLEPRPKDVEQKDVQNHSLWKRFVNPMFAVGGAADTGVRKLRIKRGYEDECEKLTLCKLHARSHRSFFAAFELYFVNKDNARLWDHHGRTLADCEAKYGDCYEEE